MKTYYLEIINKTIIVPKNILEIGSRDGHDANKLKTFFNLLDNDVWLVEPNPNQIKFITETYPNFNLIPNAIYTEETEHEFYQVNGSLDDIGTSSLINRNDNWYDSKSNKITVKTITGKKLLDLINLDIDICKLDVEGLTYEVLESFGDRLNKIKSFHIECEHVEIWKNQKLYSDVSKLLINNNYEQVNFSFCSGSNIQSDSVWVLKNYLKT